MKKIKDIGTRKWWAIAAIGLAAIAFSLDLTVLNLALPALSAALHASNNQLQWIVDSYSLVLAVLTLPAGLIGDQYGRKKWMMIALAIFGIASALCAYATSVGMLITARVILGLGAAFILPLALSVIPVFFSDKERPKAIALLMGGVFLAYPLGPILGGWLLTKYWWGSVFLVNVPIVILALVVIGMLLPENKSSERRGLDVGGIIVSSLGLVSLTYGAIEAGLKGWGNTEVATLLVMGGVILAGFVSWERYIMRSARQPLVDLGLFRSLRFTWGTLLAMTVNFSMFGLLFGLPQYFQAVQGHNALGSGYRLLALIGGLLVGSIASSKFVQKIGDKAAVAIGFLGMAIGLFIGTRTTLASHDSFTLIWEAVVGLGLGFAMPTAADAALSALSPERSGAGSALMTAIRQVGGTIGVAVLGSLMGASYRSRLHLASSLPATVQQGAKNSVIGGVSVAHKLQSSTLLVDVRAAFVHGMDVMLWVCGAIAISAVLLALLFLPNSSAVSSERKAK